MDLNFKQQLNKINTFVFDVDGVLTNGMLLVMPDGEFLRTMNIKDGYAMQLAIKKGYRITVISGGHSQGVPKRLEKLGLTEVHMGVTDKLGILNAFMQRHKIEPESILCMGDDLPDTEMMQRCGLPACPKDAVPEIRKLAVFISEFGGGEGCVRDAIEQVMKVQGTWE